MQAGLATTWSILEAREFLRALYVGEQSSSPGTFPVHTETPASLQASCRWRPCGEPSRRALKSPAQKR